MGMKQFNDKTAKKLNAIEKQLAFRAQRIKEDTEHYDALWKEAYELFDQQLGVGAPARFICEDEYVIGRIVPRMSPTINAEKFMALVRKHLPKNKATRLLNRVIVYNPYVTQSLLAQEVVKGRVDARIVEQCVTSAKASPRRLRNPASAADKQKIQAGILESPTWDEEESA